MSLPRIACFGLMFMFMCRTTFGIRVEFAMIEGAISASDMSPDGRFIVGLVDADGDGFGDGGYLLDRQTNRRTDLPTPGLGAAAVSDDGTVVVGDIPDPTGVGTNVAGRWTEASGWTSLGQLPNAGACPSRSDAYEVSADGGTVVGLSWDGCSGRGFVWTEATGMQELQNLANGNNRASVVSSDGSLIAGFAQGNFERTPAIWSADTTGALLEDANAIGEVFGLRDDGSVLVGQYLPDNIVGTPRATRWTATPTGWQGEQIGDGSLLPGWIANPMDIADNDTIVGFDNLLGNRRAWIQPEGIGPLLDLRDYFESNGAQIPTGLILEVPQAISADGRVIVGHGGISGAWIATLLDDCDFDGDLDCDLTDIDILIDAIVNDDTNPIFDLSADGVLDLDDRDAWLAQAGALNLTSGASYLVGDANLDGVVDGTDFIEWNANKFSATGLWSTADWNADGVTDGGDFILWNVNKFQSADQIAVPEPTGVAGLVLAGAMIVTARVNLSRHKKTSAE